MGGNVERIQRVTTSASLILLVLFLNSAHAADGYYDTTWPTPGGGGYFAFDGNYADSSPDTYANTVIAEASGNVLLAGTVGATWWLGEVFPNGSFVPTFGLSNGSGRTNGCSMANLCIMSNNDFSSAALDDGRFLVLGGDTVLRTTVAAHALDVSAPSSHYTINDAQGYVEGSGAVGLPGGGAIVVGDGHYSQVDTTVHFGAVRLTSTLALDTSFNAVTDNQNVTFAGGAVYAMPPGPSERADAALVQTDGRIVIVGVTGDIYSGGALGVLRMNSNGSLDATFGTGGKLTLSLPGHPTEMAFRIAPVLDSAGRIVVATSQPDAVHGSSGMLVARINASGGQDFFTAIPANAFPASCDYIDQRGKVAIDSAGRILVGGYCSSGTNDYFAVVRLRGDTGALDTTFGIGGLSYGWFDATSKRDWALSLAFDQSGRPLVAGFTHPAGAGYKAGIGRLAYDLIFTNDLEDAPRGCLRPHCN